MSRERGRNVFTNGQLVVDHRSEREKTAPGISDVQLTADPFTKSPVCVWFGDGKKKERGEKKNIRDSADE